MKQLKIAVPVENGKLCSHFGHCQYFSIIEVSNNSIVKETQVPAPPHQPGLLPQWLAEQGVTNIIAGGIGQKAITLFIQQNIQVNIGAETKAPQELAEDWIKNSLVSGVNCCDH